MRSFADDISFSYSGHDDELKKIVVSSDLRQLNECSRKLLSIPEPPSRNNDIFKNGKEDLNFTMKNNKTTVENISNSDKKHLNILQKPKS